MRPLSVGVVICAHNQARYIAATLKSVLAQTYRNFRVTVVDDGSTDRTAAVAARFLSRKISLVRLPVNRGPAAARNAALARRREDLIAFVDADDLWLPDKLEKQVAAMSKPGRLFCHSDVDLIDARGRRTPAYIARQTPRWPRILPFFKMPPCTSSVVMRRSFLDRLGRFDPAFRLLYDDVDLWCRAGRRLTKASCVFLPQTLVLKRLHGESLMAGLRRANLPHRPRDARQRALLLDRWLFHQKNRMLHLLDPRSRPARPRG